jgi:hypothetical protein
MSLISQDCSKPDRWANEMSSAALRTDGHPYSLQDIQDRRAAEHQLLGYLSAGLS